MSRDVQDLAECMRPVAVEFCARCAEAGFNVLITQTRRTAEEQQALYDQGRVRPGKVVTKARPGESPHNFGLAFDVAFRVPETGDVTWDGDWDRVGAIGERLGLVWGGRFHSFPDRPHFEWPEWRYVAAGADPTDGKSRSGGPTG